ncbi:MAG: universal stress protein [Acidobacteriota bacterium]
MKVERVLIATDFSNSSSVAPHRGVDLAQQFGAEVHLLHVVPLSELSVLAPLESTWSRDELIHMGISEAEKQVETLAEQIDFGSCSHVTAVIESEFVAEGIVEYANEHSIDVIVLGTHGRRGLRRFLLGSVAEEVVRTASCSVYTCTEEVDAVASRPREILVAVDFSDHSRAGLQFARDLGNFYQAPVRALHVVPRPHYAPEYSGAASVLVENMPEVLKAARESLEKETAAAGRFEHGIEVEAVIGSAAHEILECADEHSSDLIIIGSRGLTGIKHALLGSVADRVVRRATCPVLTVHLADV